MSSFRSVSILGAPLDGKATISMSANVLNVSTPLTAPLFVGNGSGLTNLTLTNATLINVDVIGNITGANVVATSFIRTPTAYADLYGNITATFVNATANIKTDGNAFATRFVGDHVGNLLGNVFATSAVITGVASAGFFSGNGSLLTGVVASAVLTANSVTDVTGNVTATFVNATANIKTNGNVTALNVFGNLAGNVTASFVNATANIKTNGNMFATTFFGDSVGNVSATFVNATANIKTNGNVLATNVFGDLTGNVSATFVNATANIKTNGNMFATTFFGDSVGNVSATFVNAIANIKTNGNVLALNVFGDLTGNVTATFVNATANIRTTGNVLATNLIGGLNGNVTATFVNATANIKTDGNMFAKNVTATGNVKVQGVLSFNESVTQNCMINLFPGGTATDPMSIDYMGFGTVTGNTLRYQVPTSNVSHKFFAGANVITAMNLSDGTTGSAAACAMNISKDAGTSRSINASGTVNASGADYAEYMTKAGDFEIPKGSIIGIDADGLVTNRFADSVTFAIKSTDPSFVGGDSWGTSAMIGASWPENVSGTRAPGETSDEYSKRMEAVVAWKAVLETERSRVDRVAFSGQVPCNVTGAIPGQSIVAVANPDGSIGGVGVSDPTYAQYYMSVGKVAKVLPDGRAWVIVKMG